jgi:hypothetical protein
MEHYTLKDKIQVTKEFLDDLEAKSWQEIETLQNQIANIESTEDNKSLLQLLNSLLTSYYVFVGGLDNLADKTPLTKVKNSIETLSLKKEPIKDFTTDEIVTDESESVPDDFIVSTVSISDIDRADETEYFEYFVDFDEPSGDPISEEDLYGNI